MDYFRSGLKSVLGAPQPENQPTGAETVERLVSRVTTSTLLEDRRDACRALKALSRRYRLEVGAQSMDALRQVLETDRADCEIIGYALDALCNITCAVAFEEENGGGEDGEGGAPSHHRGVNFNVGEQFTEMFIKNAENVSLVLSFLEEYDFRVRWPAVKLLTSLLQNKPKEIQDIILVSPMGVSKLMDLLGENREVVRNDALLLLIQLTKSNANIQKIVAFENAFDRLFDVIKSEGCTDGGIVVEDCLLLMLNLLRNNTSNINFFKEGSYIQRIAPMFVIAESNADEGPTWTPQKIANMHCLLKVVRTLVAPINPPAIIASAQKLMRNAQLLETLCAILMAAGVPADILAETINTVGELVRGNLTNQEYLAGLQAPSNPPRPAIVVLLMSLVNEKQPFVLRCAVLYCFECYLFKNEIGQSAVVQTLMPASVTNNNDDLTAGQLLCGGLFSHDSLSSWFSAVALSHCVLDNVAQKEQMLRVMLTTASDTMTSMHPVSLLAQCAVHLQQSAKLQTRLGLLMLLATWTANCPAAVHVLLQVQGAMAFLTAQTSASESDNNEELLQGLCAFLMGLCVASNENAVPNYSKENLAQLVEKRVGIDTYLAKLTVVQRHEVYARAAKQPQLQSGTVGGGDLLLEFEFCKLFRTLEGAIVKALGVQRDLSNGLSELSLSEHENSLLLQYKELIRDQDRRVHELQKGLVESKTVADGFQKQIQDLHSTISRLQDENTLLRAQISAGTTAHNSPGTSALHHSESYPGAIFAPAQQFNPNYQVQQVSDSAAPPVAQTTYDTVVNFDFDYSNHQQQVLPPIANNTLKEVEDYTAAYETVKMLSDSEKEMQTRCMDMQTICTQFEKENAKLRSDMEDLLELVTEQNGKLNEYRVRLHALGEVVDDDNDGDEDDDDGGVDANGEEDDETDAGYVDGAD